MSVAKKEVNYCIEVDSVLGLVVNLIGEVKAGKSPANVVVDVVPQLVQVLSGLGQLSTELADKNSLQMTVAVKVAELLTILGV